MDPSQTVSLSVLWRWASARTESGISVFLTLKLGNGTGKVLFAGRSDSEEGWKKLSEDISGDPAGIFVLERIGIPEKLGVKDSGRAWTNLRARAWIKARLEKAVSGKEFEERESGREESSRFPFGISLLEENLGKWVLGKAPAKDVGA